MKENGTLRNLTIFKSFKPGKSQVTKKDWNTYSFKIGKKEEQKHMMKENKMFRSKGAPFEDSMDVISFIVFLQRRVFLTSSPLMILRRFPSKNIYRSAIEMHHHSKASRTGCLSTSLGFYYHPNSIVALERVLFLFHLDI